MMMTDLLRVHPNLSFTLVTMASRMETALVRAANNTMRKNTMPITMPNTPRLSKTFGRAININPGPAFMPSVPIKTYTTGIIMSPARIAIRVSKISMRSTACPRFTVFFMYEP